MQTLRSILSLALVLLVLGAGATGCSRQESEWRRVRAQDTVAGYEDYLQRRPLGPHAEEARERLRALREERAWERALRLDAPEAFQQYLGAYPDGRFAEEARERLADFLLAQAPSTGPAESVALAAPALTPSPASMAPAPPSAAPRKLAVATPVPKPAPATVAKVASGTASPATATSKPAVKPVTKPVAAPMAKQAPIVTRAQAAPVAVASPPQAAAKSPSEPTPKVAADSRSKSMPKPAAAPVPRAPPVTTATKPRPGLPPAVAAGGAWRVQLGAFGAGEAAARSAWERLRTAHRAELAGLEPEIDTLGRDGRTLWRLRAGRVDGDRARTICAALRTRGAACAVVAP